MPANIAVIFHSVRGTGQQLATEVATGARAAGAVVRLARVPDGTKVLDVPIAEPEDLLWADGIVFGAPTYYGNVSAALKRFIDGTSPLWNQGLLANRVVTAFTSSTLPYGGREATLLALAQSMCHWGCFLLPTGSDNPLGLTVDAQRDGSVADADRAAARAVGRRMADVAEQLLGFPLVGAETPTRVAVVHYSSSGRTLALAEAVATGATETGAWVRLLPVAELISGCSRCPVASLADLEWADAVAFGAPARMGNMAAQLKYFVDTAELASATDVLAGKPTSAFTTTPRPHAGSEAAILSFYNTMYHFGSLVVPPGYVDPVTREAGGNPYGTSYAGPPGAPVPEGVLAAARHQGRRLALVARQLKRPRGGCDGKAV
jgi:NAD(P)H dehydrogenase (quinone)